MELLGHRYESCSSDKHHKPTQDDVSTNHVTRVAQHRSHRRYFGASWRRHHEPPPQLPESGVCQRGAAARFALGSGVETPARRDFKPLLRDRSVLRDPPLRRARHCAPPLSIALTKPPPEISNSAAGAPRPALIAQTASPPFKHGVRLCCGALRAGWRAMTRAPRNWPEKHGSP